MPTPKKVIKFLQKSKVRYDLLEHKTVYTAFDKAKTLKIKPNLVAKSLILKSDNKIVFAVLPANKNLDRNKFKKVVNQWQKKQEQKSVKRIEFVTERLIKNKFKGIKIGALPPFGNLFNYPTFVSRALLGQTKIILNSGDYNNSISIKGVMLKKLIPDLVPGSFGKSRA
jgi:Ala-tRNA(Pro) deacylase